MEDSKEAEYELVKIRFKRLYRKAKELDLKDEDLQKLEILQKYKEKKLNIIAIVVKWVLMAILLIAMIVFGLYGAIKMKYIEGKTIAGWTTLYTGVDLDSDTCLVPFTESILDYARPPVDCSFCKGISAFDRVSNLTSKNFLTNYAYTGRPVIITDATANWTAMSTFSFDYLKSIYKKDSPVFSDGSNRECQFFPYKTNFNTLGDVFKMSKKMKNMKGEKWYIGWSNCDPQAANILREHYTRPYFLSTEMESSRTDWLFMGTPGYGAHLHIDSVQHSSWQAQIKGDKEWILEPPPECYYECVGFNDTVRAGEVVVLDTNKWFHGTNVVGNTLSIVIGSEYD